MIKIKKVLNSSVVLVEDQEHKEYIVLGKGIGYGQKTGGLIDENQVDQTFVPVEDVKVKQYLGMLDAIEPVYIELTREIMSYAESKLQTNLNPGTYFMLMDHLSFAVERFKKGINLTNKVFWEIKNFYPEEFQIGLFALRLMNERLEVELPKEEAANIAFHLINAQGGQSESKDGMRYAKLIGAIVNLVRYSLHIDLDADNIHYTRFITHVKFFVERFYADQMLTAKDDLLFEQIALLYPQAMDGAFKVKDYVKQVYGKSITNDELTYLAVHIHRLMSYNELE
ncbi:transcription antiterminator BglG [Saccharibacillus sp. O16]|nr:transcription antiterminator BglG [Saccharibacillus sp. O16]